LEVARGSMDLTQWYPVVGWFPDPVKEGLSREQGPLCEKWHTPEFSLLYRVWYVRHTSGNYMFLII
jgi:hypothetical protein